MASLLTTIQDPTPGTLVEAAYVDPDYRDCYLVPGADLDLEAFAADFFLEQPGWLARVSMNLGQRTSRTQALADRTFAAGTRVGSWTVHGRASDEIMFGEHMGFMEYRFSMLRTEQGIEVTTAVDYLKPFAHIYFGIVKPFHRRFVQMALRNAARATRPQVATV